MATHQKKKNNTSDQQQRRPSVLVIGAGVGGAATAARLAHAGLDVTVVEKNDFTGGRCSLIYNGDYRFDQGPSLLLLPRLFEEAYQDLGTSLQNEGIHLRKCEPNYNIWFSDGKSFKLSTDLAAMKPEIEKYEGHHGFERYLGFLAESHRHYELSVEHVLRKNFTSFLSMARVSFLKHLLALHPLESIYSRASKYFWTERLRRVFTFASMYMGMSPYDAPGTYSLLQYTELAEGIWYPEGGFHKIVDGLVKLGEKAGVKYRFSSPVSRILLSPNNSSKAEGIELESGEKLTADIVICNADLVYAYNALLPSSGYGKSLSKRETSCSSISFYWSLSRSVPELLAHNIFLAEHYRESFDSIFKEHLIPSEPSFYVNVPSRIDPTAAPAGCDSVIVLVPVGHLLSSDSSAHRGVSGNHPPTQDWPSMVDFARRTILSTVKTRIGVDLGPLIAHEQVNTPETWKEKFNLDRGAILGLSHSFFNVLSFRPKTKHSSINNLYFVGASTHPGTGVPICLAGSKIVSEQICGDVGVQVPWVPAAKAGKPDSGKANTKIDRVVGGGPSLGVIVLALLSLLVLSVAVLIQSDPESYGSLVGDW